MTAAPPASAPVVVTFGEVMGLFRATSIGTPDVARSFDLGIGGAEGNVAIGIARLGGHAQWIGRVGSDAIGDLIIRRMNAESVDTIAVRDEGFTGLMVRHHHTGDLRRVDYYRAGSAGSRLRSGDIPRGMIESARVLHITGITPALSDSAHDAVLAALDIAEAAGVLVSFDVNYRSKLWNPATAARVLRPIAARADILFAGIAEAALLLGGDERDAPEVLARGLADLGPDEVLLKTGEHGSTAWIAGNTLIAAAPAVTVVDPVGAGDAFVAGYLAERLHGAGFKDCLATAVAAGAYAVTVPGDCELLPTRADLAAAADAADVVR